MCIRDRMWIELFIKAIMGNALMLFGLPILQSLLGVASTTSTIFLDKSEVQIVPDNIDIGAVLAYILIGILFVLASIAVSYTHLDVYKRQLLSIVEIFSIVFMSGLIVSTGL